MKTNYCVTWTPTRVKTAILDLIQNKVLRINPNQEELIYSNRNKEIYSIESKNNILKEIDTVRISKGKLVYHSKKVLTSENCIYIPVIYTNEKWKLYQNIIIEIKRKHYEITNTNLFNCRKYEFECHIYSIDTDGYIVQSNNLISSERTLIDTYPLKVKLIINKDKNINIDHKINDTILSTLMYMMSKQKSKNNNERIVNRFVFRLNNFSILIQNDSKLVFGYQKGINFMYTDYIQINSTNDKTLKDLFNTLEYEFTEHEECFILISKKYWLIVPKEKWLRNQIETLLRNLNFEKLSTHEYIFSEFSLVSIFDNSFCYKKDEYSLKNNDIITYTLDKIKNNIRNKFYSKIPSFSSHSNITN